MEKAPFNQKALVGAFSMIVIVKRRKGSFLALDLQQLLHEERVLGDALDRLEQVEGERHALHPRVRLTLPQQTVELGARLHQVLQQRRRGHLRGAEADVGCHRGELKHPNIRCGFLKCRSTSMRLNRMPTFSHRMSPTVACCCCIV